MSRRRLRCSFSLQYSADALSKSYFVCHFVSTWIFSSSFFCVCIDGSNSGESCGSCLDTRHS